ncbi:glycerate kinase [Pseudalkalibacillus caeni]|uniref:Glycerate kinase n=1 Tax=Exobacillus caeni TaxID=2574798 RepID=A0A5R9EYC9_9BACL|nr:glycerate kinase [Pseudalkalibacillus caeni]TLS35060.1 glycerate kinase [Pseudalkalibacillus caeni]
MKIVIAPDSFKESMTAMEAADAIAKGFSDVFPEAEIIRVPIADGGEGTVTALVDATGGRMIKAAVSGPLGKPVQAFYGLSGDGSTAFIEMAAASGLHLVPEKSRNPLYTSTRGTGELILKALDQGVSRIILGLGGSATNDAGAGMAQAVGVKLIDRFGNEIKEGGASLGDAVEIDCTNIDKRLAGITIEAACDVNNPMVGERGASAVFGPQKGANTDMVRMLDKNLSYFADLIKKELGKDIKYVPGTGAAGGLAGGLIAFLSAQLMPGVEMVLKTIGLEEHLRDASLVVTGEGKVDGQTAFGKAPAGVAALAKKYHLPVIAVAGQVNGNNDVLRKNGFDAVFSIIPGVIPLEEALENASSYTYHTARNIAEVLKINWK